MSRGWRTIARVGAFAALALLLTGCLKLNMNLLVGSDDTVTGTVQFGISKEVLELTGSTPEDLLGSDAPFPEDAEGVTVTPFDDGEFAGQEFTFENVPLAEFNDPDNPDALTITRSGDTFTVAGVLDLGTGTTGATGALGGTAAELFESADIRVTLTFPGDVIDSNGDEVEGNTVTWIPEFGERLEISATASAVDDGDGEEIPEGAGGDDGGSSLTLILIIVGALVVAAIVVFVIMSQRKKGQTPPGTPMGGDMMGGTPPAGPPVPPASPPVPPAAPPAPPAAPPAPPSPG